MEERERKSFYGWFDDLLSLCKKITDTWLDKKIKIGANASDNKVLKGIKKCRSLQRNSEEDELKDIVYETYSEFRREIFANLGKLGWMDFSRNTVNLGFGEASL